MKCIKKFLLPCFAGSILLFLLLSEEICMASNSTITTSSQVQSSGPSYYGGDGPTLPHLVGFTLAIVSLAIALGECNGILFALSALSCQRDCADRCVLLGADAVQVIGIFS